MKFNENLKYLRSKAKLSQEKLAEDLNVSRQAVTKWESGQALPDIVNLKNIAIFFGVTVDELLGDDKITNSTSFDKKIKDLPLYLFASIVTILIFISELGITDTTAMGIIIILFIPIEAWCLKNYLTGRKIMDLTDTKEGKKARLKFMLTESSIVSSIFGLAQIVIYLVRSYKGLEVYETITEIIVTTLISFIILFIVRALTLRDEVKEYNNKK